MDCEFNSQAQTTTLADAYRPIVINFGPEDNPVAAGLRKSIRSLMFQPVGNYHPGASEVA